MSNMQETKAKAEAKAEEMSQCAKDTATEAKDRTVDAAHSATDSAIETKDKTVDAAHSATDSATDSIQHGKDQSAGFLQQTGEQMKSMTQGAMETVKSTLGVSDKK
ncbi:late embryogenesis abundant protein 2-like [Cannabis sativa]|uniref:Uncharacterized protein n=1 Tax=Cannabis sativa TaxID=3483 RepID=A0A7J6FJU9_CANSA|nr:late embryogenesis abundant protein 2-like [Cannabis sativa]KAF4351589.1 hypothetical protein F8388_003242 [Cannabis sativa]KAF4370917.1 hypothetical protein G4B88_012717 [Cannabis sativa]